MQINDVVAQLEDIKIILVYLDIAGEDYKVDEKIVLDLTQFQLNGVDIIRVFTRTVTYVAFIAFLIKITPHVIKH